MIQVYLYMKNQYVFYAMKASWGCVVHARQLTYSGRVRNLYNILQRGQNRLMQSIVSNNLFNSEEVRKVCPPPWLAANASIRASIHSRLLQWSKLFHLHRS